MKKFLLLIPALALVGLAVKPVFAWDFDVSGSAVCNEQTGQYDVTWLIDNPESEEATIASSNRASVSGTIPADSSKQYEESVPGNSTSVELTVELDWPSDDNQPPKTATVELEGDCEAPEQPPVATPPQEQPKVEQQVPVVPVGGVDTGEGGTALK